MASRPIPVQVAQIQLKVSSEIIENEQWVVISPVKESGNRPAMHTLVSFVESEIGKALVRENPLAEHPFDITRGNPHSKLAKSIPTSNTLYIHCKDVKPEKTLNDVVTFIEQINTAYPHLIKNLTTIQQYTAEREKVKATAKKPGRKVPVHNAAASISFTDMDRHIENVLRYAHTTQYEYNTESPQTRNPDEFHAMAERLMESSLSKRTATDSVMALQRRDEMTDPERKRVKKIVRGLRSNHITIRNLRDNHTAIRDLTHLMIAQTQLFAQAEKKQPFFSSDARNEYLCNAAKRISEKLQELCPQLKNAENKNVRAALVNSLVGLLDHDLTPRPNSRVAPVQRG